MPTPLVGGHVDAVLSNISVAWHKNQSRFIAEQVFPVVNVAKQSDLYYSYNRGDWFRDEARQRADGTESVGSGFGMATDSYNAKVWAFHKDVGPQARANFASPFDADRDAAEFVTSRLILRQEVQWVQDYMRVGVWGTDYTPVAGDKWSTYATSDPAAQIGAAEEALLGVTGFAPNTLVVGYRVDRMLRNHPVIKDRIKYTSADNVTSELVAKWLGVEKYLVASSVKNIAQEGAADAMQFINGNDALLVYAAPSPSLLSPSAGYTFVWQGISKGIGTNLAISTIPTPLLGDGAVRIEGQIAYDNKVVAPELGYFFKDVVV